MQESNVYGYLLAWGYTRNSGSTGAINDRVVGYRPPVETTIINSTGNVEIGDSLIMQVVIKPKSPFRSAGDNRQYDTFIQDGVTTVTINGNTYGVNETVIMSDKTYTVLAMWTLSTEWSAPIIEQEPDSDVKPEAGLNNTTGAGIKVVTDSSIKTASGSSIKKKTNSKGKTATDLSVKPTTSSSSKSVNGSQGKQETDLRNKPTTENIDELMIDPNANPAAGLKIDPNAVSSKKGLNAHGTLPRTGGTTDISFWAGVLILFFAYLMFNFRRKNIFE